MGKTKDSMYFRIDISYGEPTRYDGVGEDGMFISGIERADKYVTALEAEVEREPAIYEVEFAIDQKGTDSVLVAAFDMESAEDKARLQMLDRHPDVAYLEWIGSHRQGQRLE